MAPQVKMPGFRPGKVPANLLKKVHGAQLHQEALNTSIREAMDQLVAEKQLRPATQPEVALGEGYAPGQDAELTVALEVLPVIAAPDLTGIKLEKLVVPVAEEQVDEAVTRIAGSSKSFSRCRGRSCRGRWATRSSSISSASSTASNSTAARPRMPRSNWARAASFPASRSS